MASLNYVYESIMKYVKKIYKRHLDFKSVSFRSFILLSFIGGNNICIYFKVGER